MTTNAECAKARNTMREDIRLLRTDLMILLDSVGKMTVLEAVQALGAGGAVRMVAAVNSARKAIERTEFYDS